MNSMTGFGRAQGVNEQTTLTVEIQSVNRRNLEVSFNLPREWQMMEKEFTEVLKAKVGRGKVSVQTHLSTETSSAALSWNEEALAESMKKLQQLHECYDMDWPPSSDTLLRLISLQKTDGGLQDPEEALDWVRPIFEEALGRFVSMRKQEGGNLKADLEKRLEFLQDSIKSVQEEVSQTVPRYRDLLFQRLSQAGLELDLEDERVLKELALFADKCDISEELTRLQSHFEQFSETLNQADEIPVGRKLEFILQEIHREINTVGSKANNVIVSRIIIDAKNELERIREQIQNVE